MAHHCARRNNKRHKQLNGANTCNCNIALESQIGSSKYAIGTALPVGAKDVVLLMRTMTCRIALYSGR